MDFVISASATEQDLSNARVFFVEQHDPSQPETQFDSRLLVLVGRKPARLRSKALARPAMGGLSLDATKQ